MQIDRSHLIIMPFIKVDSFNDELLIPNGASLQKYNITKFKVSPDPLAFGYILQFCKNFFLPSTPKPLSDVLNSLPTLATVQMWLLEV